PTPPLPVVPQGLPPLRRPLHHRLRPPAPSRRRLPPRPPGHRPPPPGPTPRCRGGLVSARLGRYSGPVTGGDADVGTEPANVPFLAVEDRAGARLGRHGNR